MSKVKPEVVDDRIVLHRDGPYMVAATISDTGQLHDWAVIGPGVNQWSGSSLLDAKNMCRLVVKAYEAGCEETRTALLSSDTPDASSGGAA